jgi:hypothetical protein
MTYAHWQLPFLLAASLLGTTVEAQQPGAMPPLSPAVQKVSDHLCSAASASRTDAARDVTALASKEVQFKTPDLATFVNDLLDGLANVKVSAGHASDLALDLQLALNPSRATPRQLRGAMLDFPHMLKVSGMAWDKADAVGLDLQRLVPLPTYPLPPDAPAHKYRFEQPEAPMYDKSVLVDDFERGGDFFKGWYSPEWSHGLKAVFDPDHKSTGKYGATISDDNPIEELSGTSTIPKPALNIQGMNALRMWIQPYGYSDEQGLVATGLVDGTNQIWQIDLPGALSGTQPYVLQVRLEDFRRVLRRNTGKIAPECRNFGFWILGTYKFTVDNVRFVHDPSISELDPK